MDCWYSLEPPRRGEPNEYPQSMFLAEIWKKKKKKKKKKKSEFFFCLKTFSIWWWNLQYIWIGVFVMLLPMAVKQCRLDVAKKSNNNKKNNNMTLGL